jgi:hypothetical protein
MFPHSGDYTMDKMKKQWRIWVVFMFVIIGVFTCGIVGGMYLEKKASEKRIEFEISTEIQFRSWLVLSSYMEGNIEDIIPVLDYNLDEASEKVASAFLLPHDRSIVNEPYMNCLVKVREFRRKYGRIAKELPKERWMEIDRKIDKAIDASIRSGELPE